ncbi:MAG TPA: sigma-70 family RNA polymerase sigma factor, partial [Candidatus Gracilibacteria bacterium]|nr:sigma-70 family RNA polymerase sigma factor [Candidatus Gracilibacteria bacterium]
MDLQEEQQLVEDAKTNTESFGKLYDLYFPKIFAFVRAKTNNRDDAEDLVSEVFMKALENIPNYEWRGIPFAAWLFTIARNTLNNYYVKSGKTKHSDLEEARLVVEDEQQVSPHKKAAQEELAEQVRAVLAELPEKELNVVQLKFFAQLNNREIVHVTGLSESNVAVILFRTLKKIKPDLQYFAGLKNNLLKHVVQK